LNIGIVIFAAVYAFLPRLLGRPLYSDRLGMWHIWLTFSFGTANSVVWLIQGLDGAPRRFSILAGQYDAMTAASIPIIVVLTLAQLLFVWNIVQTLRGATSSATMREGLAGVPRPRLTSPSLQGLAIVMTVLVMTGLGAAGWGVARAGHDPATAAFVPVAQVAATGELAGTEGARVFTAAGCGGCHTLSAAASTGAIGPNLDVTTLDEQGIARVVERGAPGMPAFAGRLSADEIRAVAEYVVAAKGP
jgi:cytochrome c oxidase subunit I